MKWRLYKEADDDFEGDEEDAPFEGIIAKEREYAEPNNDDCLYDDFLKVEGAGEDLEFSTMSGHTSSSCTEYEELANDAVYDWRNRFDEEGDVKDFVLEVMLDQTGEEWEYSGIYGSVQGEYEKVLHKKSDRKLLKYLEEDYFGLGRQYDCYDGETEDYIVTVFVGDSRVNQTKEEILDACGYDDGTEVKIVKFRPSYDSISVPV